MNQITGRPVELNSPLKCQPPRRPPPLPLQEKDLLQPHPRPDVLSAIVEVMPLKIVTPLRRFLNKRSPTTTTIAQSMMTLMPRRSRLVGRGRVGQRLCLLKALILKTTTLQLMLLFDLRRLWFRQRSALSQRIRPSTLRVLNQ